MTYGAEGRTMGATCSMDIGKNSWLRGRRSRRYVEARGRYPGPEGFARKMVEGLLNVDGWADDPGALGKLGTGRGARSAERACVVPCCPTDGQTSLYLSLAKA